MFKTTARPGWPARKRDCRRGSYPG